MDQGEVQTAGELRASLELFSRMPGKAAPVRWVFLGRSEPRRSPDGAVASWLHEANPTRLALSASLEEGAWELFQHRVRPACGTRSNGKRVATLLNQSEGLPGRFDAAVRTAIDAGLLQGNPALAA